MRQKTNFQLIIEANKPIFEARGLFLTVEGYSHFIKEYLKTSETDSKSNFSLAKDALLWSDYLSDLKSTTTYLKEITLLESDNLKAFIPPRKKVHELKSIYELRMTEFKALKLLEKSFESQIKLCHFIYKKARDNQHNK